MALAHKHGADLTPSHRDCLKLIVFDFDQTLSAIHVFKTLAGWSKGDVSIPPPHATTERGQIQRISELSETRLFKDAGGFATVAFGGESRVEGIRQMLERLRACDIEMIVLTKGLVGVVRKCLFDLGLLDLFSDVYGNIGDNYGETSYDKAISRTKPSERDLQFIASPDKNLSMSKAELIQRWACNAGLSREQVCLVEDDSQEVRRAAPVCRTLWVKEAQGMTQRECSSLLRMAEGREVRSAGRLDSRPHRLLEDEKHGSRSDSRPSRFTKEVRQYDMSISKKELDRCRFEIPPTDRNTSASRLECDVLQQELAKLSLEEPGRNRRAKSNTDGTRARRPSSRSGNTRGALLVAGAKMLDA
mmetsp:Transcript_104093/g.164381  ORF Transcript_104093/g.164381 Transcript_104093/m.164381 type:complete len:360 (+) Transcript_104093:61-1140(+)